MNPFIKWGLIGLGAAFFVTRPALASAVVKLLIGAVVAAANGLFDLIGTLVH